MRRLGQIFFRLMKGLFYLFVGLGVIWAGLFGLAHHTLTALDQADPGASVNGRPDIALGGVRLPALELVAQVHTLRQPQLQGTASAPFRDCPDCPDMVTIPAGIYLMGSPLTELARYTHIVQAGSLRRHLRVLNREGPRLLVTIPEPLAISRFEVSTTQWATAQADPDWEAVTGRAPRLPSYLPAPSDDLPISEIDWFDAQAFARWLSHKTGQTYRLPTEAEWEYAARAGSAGPYFWGTAPATGQAACADCDGRVPDMLKATIGQYAPNSFGLYDMHGNVWEWVEDCFVPYHAPLKRTGAAHVFDDCEFRAFRGGSIFDKGWKARASMRAGPHPFNDDIGSTIRLVRTVPYSVSR